MTDHHSPGFSHFFAQAAALPLLSAAEERELARRIQRGDLAARNKLVERNIRLAITIAKGYRSRGLPFEDLVSEGAIGLNRAAEKFDWTRGYRFSTYATWWIRHYVQRAVMNAGQTIRTPGNVTIARLKMETHLQQHPDATLDDLAEVGNIPVEQVPRVLNTARVVASIDTMLDDDENSAYELLADHDAERPDEVLIQDHRVANALRQLPDLERRVIELRFGFDGPVRGRDEVAAELGVKPHVVQRAQRLAFIELHRLLQDTAAAPDGAPGPGPARPRSAPVCTRVAADLGEDAC